MKPSYEKYRDWYKQEFKVDLNSKPSHIFQFVIPKLHQEVVDSLFWKELEASFDNYNDEYYLMYGYPLFTHETLPLSIKSYSSVLNKTYRKNVISNNDFPKEPEDGWITPENWFTKIKDLLRTTLTVKYLDGVEFIVDKIEILSKKHKFQFWVDYEAREEGYYAAHINLTKKFEIVDEKWELVEVPFTIEIQITTQLQEVIKGLLHKYYETQRIEHTNEKSQKWQWNYKSKEFSSNYLGHILHYVEGMILEVRDKQLNQGKNES